MGCSPSFQQPSGNAGRREWPPGIRETILRDNCSDSDDLSNNSDLNIDGPSEDKEKTFQEGRGRGQVEGKARRGLYNRSNSLIHIRSNTSKLSLEKEENSPKADGEKHCFEKNHVVHESISKDLNEDISMQHISGAINYNQAKRSQLKGPFLSNVVSPSSRSRENLRLNRSPASPDLPEDSFPAQPTRLPSRTSQPKVSSYSKLGPRSLVPTKEVVFKVNIRKVKLVMKKEEIIRESEENESLPDSPGDRENIVSGSVTSQLNRTFQSSFKEEGSVKHSQASKTYNAVGNLRVNQYEFLNSIGRGTFGQVFKVRHLKDKKLYAIKQISEKKTKLRLGFDPKDKFFDEVRGEIAIYKKVSHENIIKLFEVIEDKEQHMIYLVMDYVEKGAVLSAAYWASENFSTLGGASFKIGLEKAKKYFRQLVQAVYYLHNCANIVHRDIKPANILIDKDDNVKLTDFGISEIISDSGFINHKLGTTKFQPPEVFEGGQVWARGLDIWAMGVTLFIFLEGRHPFKESFVPCDLKILETKLPAEAKQLVLKCMKKNPKERAQIESLVKDPWLTDFGRDPIQVMNSEFPQIDDEDIKRAVGTVQNTLLNNQSSE